MDGVTVLVVYGRWCIPLTFVAVSKVTEAEQPSTRAIGQKYNLHFQNMPE